MSLSSVEIESYFLHGYVTVKSVYLPEEVAAMQAAADQFVERSRDVVGSDDVFDMGASSPSGRLELRRVRDPERHHPAFSAAHRNPRLLSALRSLLGPDIRAHSSKLNIKQPKSTTAVEWHQDWAFGASTNDDVLTVGIAIGPMNRVTGCLEVVPGSHTGPVLDHERNGRFTGAVTETDFQPDGAVPIELDPGDVSVHHTRTLHGSAPNRSDASRYLLLFTYSAADAWPLLGVPDQHAYDALMLCGVAPRAPRLAAVPVRPLPQWDELDGTSLFELQEADGQGMYRTRVEP